MTIKDANRLSLINETLEQLTEGILVLKLHLIGAYHQLRIREDIIYKTAIQSRFDLFEWLVLWFRITNVPIEFKKLVAEIFKEFNEEYLAFYLNDVVMYSRLIEKHMEHVKKVLELLEDTSSLRMGLNAKRNWKNIFSWADLSQLEGFV